MNYGLAAKRWVGCLETGSMKVGRSTSDEAVMTLLTQLGEVLASAEDVDAFMQSALRMILSVMHVEGCSIFVLDSSEGLLRLKASSRISPQEWPSILIRLGEGIVGIVAQSGEELFARDARTLKELTGQSIPRPQYKSPDFISVPVSLRGQTIGVINVDSRTDGSHFSQWDVALLKGIAVVFASALSTSRQMREQVRAGRHFSSILQSVPMGVMTFDKSLHLTHCNRAAGELFALEPSQVVGKAVHTIFPDFLRPRILELITELRVTGIASCGQVELPLGPGERPHPLGLSAWSLDESNGLREGIVLLFEDLSLRREITELRQLSELKSHFLSLISHELRTPLTSVIGSIHLLRGTGGQNCLDACQQRILGIIDRNVHRLAGVVEDILEVQRIETETIQLTLENVDVECLLDETLNKRQEAWKEKGISVELISSIGDLKEICLDRDRIRQVFKHCLDNAFKFCKIGGNVWVWLDQKFDRVEVRIGNSGPPIPMKYRDQIFDKFYQVENTMTRQFGGPGLGLYLARQLLRLHGGDIVLELSTEDQTVFLATIPIIEQSCGEVDAPKARKPALKVE